MESWIRTRLRTLARSGALATSDPIHADGQKATPMPAPSATGPEHNPARPAARPGAA